MKLHWYICANTIDVVKNFAVIKNVTIKSFHCSSRKMTMLDNSECVFSFLEIDFLEKNISGILSEFFVCLFV